MMLLRAAGLRVPAWVVTNDAETAERFLAASADGAVYKSCSGLRSHVREADERLLERLRAGTAPVLLQEYGGTEARVHVVGEETFATAVVASAVDYRFASDENEYAPADAPEKIAALSVAVTRREGLLLSGLDFRIDSDGEWWCLELNLVPTFLPVRSGERPPDR